MSDVIVALDSICFSYEQNLVLDTISLDIKSNDFLAVIGPNGGGKSTLLKLILGLIKPQSGTLTVFGKSPEEGRERVGYMPQFKAQTQHYPISVLEVVLLGCMSKNMFHRFSKEDRDRAMDCLKNVQGELLHDRPFSKLSGGQQQRVLLARALMQYPKLLILDEPTCSIDQPTGQHFFDLLTKLNNDMAILMVSHDLTAVSHSAKTIVCLNKTLSYHSIKNMSPDAMSHAYCNHVDLITHVHPHRVLSEHDS